MASMRPRQACLGILVRVHVGTEAVAGFNEAEASLPRNTGCEYDGFVRIDLASMRPRQACLGIPGRLRPSLVGQARFNEAEASLPRNTIHMSYDAWRDYWLQ